MAMETCPPIRLGDATKESLRTGASVGGPNPEPSAWMIGVTVIVTMVHRRYPILSLHLSIQNSIHPSVYLFNGGPQKKDKKNVKRAWQHLVLIFSAKNIADGNQIMGIKKNPTWKARTCTYPYISSNLYIYI